MLHIGPRALDDLTVEEFYQAVAYIDRANEEAKKRG